MIDWINVEKSLLQQECTSYKITLICYIGNKSLFHWFHFLYLIFRIENFELQTVNCELQYNNLNPAQLRLRIEEKIHTQADVDVFRGRGDIWKLFRPGWRGLTKQKGLPGRTGWLDRWNLCVLKFISESLQRICCNDGTVTRSKVFYIYNKLFVICIKD